MSVNRRIPKNNGSAPSRPPYLAFAALALLALIWGYNWVNMKIGIRHSEPFTFAAMRGFLGAAVLFSFVVLLRKPLKPVALLFTVALGLLQSTGFVGLIMWALQSGSASRTTVLTYTMPFWVLLMAWPVLGERIKGLQWLAVGVALSGLILILRPWHFTGSLGSSLMAVGGGLSWAASIVLYKVMRRRHEVELLSFTAWQMLIGSVPLVLIAVFTFKSPDWSGAFIWALAFNAIPGSAIAWLLWLYALHKLSAGITGISSLAIPVVGVLSAWIQLGERPNDYEAVGMLVIMAALAILTTRGVVLSRPSRKSTGYPSPARD